MTRFLLPRSTFFLAVFLLGLTSILVGCGEDAEISDDPTLARISFATDWVAQAEHGGFYMAKALGLYRARGLNVTIRPGGAAVNIPQLLAAGSVDFAMGSNSFIPLNLVQAGVPARAVMASFQKDPQVLITHPRDDVNTLGDMRGKPIMISDATRTAWWPWLEAEFGFSEDQIRKYTSSVAPFLVDPQAIQQGYITSEPYLIERELGVEPEVYLLADYGYPSYATLVMTRDETIEQRPEIVRAFVAASIEGWRRYLTDDPEPAHALIRADNPDISSDVLNQARAKLIRFEIVMEDAGASVGTMSMDRWAHFFSTMSEAGLYEDDLEWSQAFTTAFLPGAQSIEAGPAAGPEQRDRSSGTRP